MKALKAILSVLVSLALSAAAQAQNIPRSCDLDFPNRPGTTATIRQDPNGNRTTFLSGGIVAHCIGQGNTLTADSAEHYEAEGRLYLVGNVHYTEPRLTVDSRTMTYYQRDDHLHAEGDVVAVMPNGSTLRGPSADYYRSTPQRPRTRMFAPGRPRVTLVQRDTTGRGRPPDTAHVVANRITMEGDSLVYAAGRVEITRPDLVATGDSAFLDSGTDFARLMREPLVKGIGKRTFTLTGGVVDVYSKNRQLERVVATPNGHALSQDLELVADTIDLRLQRNELQRAIAWGKGRRARPCRPSRNRRGFDRRIMREAVREVRALRNAYAKAIDSVACPTRDWLRGARSSLASTGVATDTRAIPVREILAEGNARSFYK